jgi:hypothetical protein
MHIIRLIVFFFIMVVVLVSCGSTPEETAKVEKKESKVKADNIELIQVSEIPLYPQKQVLFETDLVIDEQDQEGEIKIYKPFIIQVDDDQNIYVGDEADQTIKVFDRRGTFKRTIGRKGKGPGEFDKVVNMIILPEGQLLVLDYGNRRTSIFDSNGEFFKSWKWVNTYHLFVYLGSDSYYAADNTIYGKETRLFINRYDFSEKELLSYGEFTPRQIKFFKKGEALYPIFTPHSKLSLFVGCQQTQWLYHCLSNKYLIEVYDVNGKLFRKISRPGYKPLPFTKKDADEYFLQVEKIRNKSYVKMAKKVVLPKFKAVVARLLVDDQGNLWVQTNEFKEENDKYFVVYDVFNHKGIYEAKIWSNVHPFLIKGGNAYTIELNKETGARFVGRYTVKWIETDR